MANRAHIHQGAHRLFPGRPGICPKGVADIRAQLLQRVGHLFPPMLVCVTSRVLIIRCIGAGKQAEAIIMHVSRTATVLFSFMR